MIGGAQTALPALSASRRAALAGPAQQPPRRTAPLHPALNVTDFYVSLLDNDLHEVAANSLLDFPAGSTVFLDTTVGVWAQTAQEAGELSTLAESWTFNLDLSQSLHVCGVDGLPLDTSVCE